MAVPTYTARIWAGTITPATGHKMAPVPAGKRMVVRSVYNVQPTATGAFLALRLSPSNVVLTRVSPASDPLATSWEGRIVIHELEVLELVAVVSQSIVSVHGYLFDGAGPSLNLTSTITQYPETKPAPN